MKAVGYKLYVCFPCYETVWGHIGVKDRVDHVIKAIDESVEKPNCKLKIMSR